MPQNSSKPNLTPPDIPMSLGENILGGIVDTAGDWAHRFNQAVLEPAGRLMSAPQAALTGAADEVMNSKGQAGVGQAALAGLRNAGKTIAGMPAMQPADMMRKHGLTQPMPFQADVAGVPLEKVRDLYTNTVTDPLNFLDSPEKAGVAMGAAIPAGVAALKGLNREGHLMQAGRRFVDPEPIRMMRAAEQGFIHDMYHGTSSPAMTQMPSAIAGPHFDFGIHVTPNPKTANTYAFGHTDYGEYEKLLHDYKNLSPADIEELAWEGITPQAIDDVSSLSEKEQGSGIMPLKVRMNKTLPLNQDLVIWKDPHSWINRLDPKNAGTHMAERSLDRTPDPALFESIWQLANNSVRRQGVKQDDLHHYFQQDLKSLLQGAGYDSFSYPNKIEGQGELSYGLLDPRQVRSRFAQFNPANQFKPELLGSFGLPLAGLAAAAPDKQKKR